MLSGLHVRHSENVLIIHILMYQGENTVTVFHSVSVGSRVHTLVGVYEAQSEELVAFMWSRQSPSDYYN